MNKGVLIISTRRNENHLDEALTEHNEITLRIFSKKMCFDAVFGVARGHEETTFFCNVFLPKQESASMTFSMEKLPQSKDIKDYDESCQVHELMAEKLAGGALRFISDKGAIKINSNKRQLIKQQIEGCFNLKFRDYCKSDNDHYYPISYQEIPNN